VVAVREARKRPCGEALAGRLVVADKPGGDRGVTHPDLRPGEASQSMWLRVIADATGGIRNDAQTEL
jgi:hypothetical protein